MGFTPAQPIVYLPVPERGGATGRANISLGWLDQFRHFHNLLPDEQSPAGKVGCPRTLNPRPEWLVVITGCNLDYPAKEGLLLCFAGVADLYGPDGCNYIIVVEYRQPGIGLWFASQLHHPRLL